MLLVKEKVLSGKVTFFGGKQHQSQSYPADYLTGVQETPE